MSNSDVPTDPSDALVKATLRPMVDSLGLHLELTERQLDVAVLLTKDEAAMNTIRVYFATFGYVSQEIKLQESKMQGTVRMLPPEKFVEFIKCGDPDLADLTEDLCKLVHALPHCLSRGTREELALKEKWDRVEINFKARGFRRDETDVEENDAMDSYREIVGLADELKPLTEDEKRRVKEFTTRFSASLKQGKTQGSER